MSLGQALRKSAVAGILLDRYPVSQPLYDGEARTVLREVAQLFKIWGSYPELRKESEEVYATYEGGDLLDVGAFHGWYSWLLAPKGGESTFVSFEPDRRAYLKLLGHLAALSRVFPSLQLMPVSRPVGNGQPMRVSFPWARRGTRSSPAAATTSRPRP